MEMKKKIIRALMVLGKPHGPHASEQLVETRLVGDFLPYVDCVRGCGVNIALTFASVLQELDCLTLILAFRALSQHSHAHC